MSFTQENHFKLDFLLCLCSLGKIEEIVSMRKDGRKNNFQFPVDCPMKSLVDPLISSYHVLLPLHGNKR